MLRARGLSEAPRVSERVLSGKVVDNAALLAIEDNFRRPLGCSTTSNTLYVIFLLFTYLPGSANRN